MIEQLIRTHLRQFEPYHSARSEMDGGANGRELIYLDANELALGSPVDADGIKLNRYPDPFQRELRSAIAKRFEIGQNHVFVGVGSDEIIDLLIRLFCEPGKDSVVILQPTYGVYGVSAALNDVERIDVPLNDNFQIDVERTMQSVKNNSKLIFCCSPNNPTGNVLRKEDILELADSTNCIVIVDEAYGEFAEPGHVIQPGDVTKRENVVILKTLSKAWGSAGIRLGYCIGHPDIVSYLLRIKAPYNINALTSAAALKVVLSVEFMNSSVSTIRKEREKLTNLFQSLNEVMNIHPSDANFILIEFRDAKRAYEHLFRAGFVVRRRNEERLHNCLRITVGTAEENVLLIRTLSELK